MHVLFLVCKVGVPFLEVFANYKRFPNLQTSGFQLKRLTIAHVQCIRLKATEVLIGLYCSVDISGTKIGSCSVSSRRNQKLISLHEISTQAVGQFRFK